MTDGTTTETVGANGMFVCSCLWSGTLSFSPEEAKDLDGEIRRYMGPCPECGRNSLALVDDTPSDVSPWEREGGERGAIFDDLMDEVEDAAAGAQVDEKEKSND